MYNRTTIFHVFRRNFTVPTPATNWDENYLFSQNVFIGGIEQILYNCGIEKSTIRRLYNIFFISVRSEHKFYVASIKYMVLKQWTIHKNVYS